MRKLLLSFLAVLCLLCPAKAGVWYALAPVGFEDGALPDGWTQENIEGTVNWQVEGGPGVSLTDPVGAKSGDYRLAIRRAKGATSGFVTRLISPAMDISEMQNPQLCFAYAQVATFDYFDTLRVWYRTTADAQWTLLEEFTSPVPAWKNETLPLEKYLQGTAYQIAFEVADHAGKGVVLDDICVLQPSQCQQPQFQMLQPSSHSAFIEFVAGGTGYGSQADLFDLIVSDSALADPAAAQASQVLYMQKGMTDNSVTVTGLDAYTTYYAYLRTNCADNASGYTEWTSTQFKTSMSKSLPYVENFNQKSASSTSSYITIPGWTFATDIDKANVPYVYAGTSSKDKQYYSVDSTSYLAFVGDASYSISPVPKGKYLYAATPELDGNLSQCEVSFWGTAYNHISDGVDNDYAAELTVGVMTNPTDYTTFTPVKTVTVESGYQFKHFVVSLSGYQGNGKYVALRSAAAKENIFFVDNFSVAVAAAPVPEDIRISNLQPSGFDVSAALHGADSWNIKVATKYVRNPASLAAAACLVSQTGLTASSFHVASADLAGKTVCVYLQAVKNGVSSDWAFPVTLRVPTVGSIPLTLDMTGNAELSLYTFNNEIHYRSSAKTINGIYFPLRSFAYYPTLSTSSPTWNGGHLNLQGTDNYFVLPYVENMDSLMLSFRLTTGSWSSSYYSYTGQSRVAVGVMTDPYDLSTFVEVARFEGDDTKYIKCETDFLSYTGTGHYVAIRAIEAAQKGSYNTYNALDDIVLKKIPACRLPKNVVSDPQVSTAALSWDAQAMTKWLVSLYGDSQLTTLLQDSVVTAPAVTFDGLSSGNTYYFTVRTICGTDTLDAEDTYSFTTLFGIPFMEKFTTTSIPDGWSRWQGLLADVFSGKTTLTSVTSYWNFDSQSRITTDGYVAYINICYASRKHWLMMPELYINADKDDAVQLSFEAALISSYSSSTRNSGTDDQFAVVISTDNGTTWTRANATIWNNANDSTTDFVLNDLPDDKMQKYTINLSKYIGTKIRIAFYAESTESNANNYLLIDNVSVNTFDVNCQGVKSLSATALSETEADIFWTVVGTQSLHLDVYADKSTAPLFSGDVTASPYRLTGLTSNTPYRVVAHQSCDLNGDSLTTSFRTQCGASTPAQLGTVNFADPDAFMCWTVGIGDTTGVANFTLTAPGISNITGFGKVLYLKKPKSTSSSYYGNDYYAILPPLDIDDITEYQVVFDAAVNTTKADTANVAKLYVGVITDPADLSTLEITDTLTLQYAADSMALRSYAIGFDNYQGDYLGGMGKYILLKVAAPRDYSDIAIVDNVRIEAGNACHQILNVEVSDIKTDAAALRWTSDAGSVRVVVSPVMCNPDTVSDFIFDNIIANTGSATVSGLSAGTTYYAYVRAICGVGDTARWSGHTVFTTSYGVPYAENFSAGRLASDWVGYRKSFPAGSDTLDISSLAPATGTTAWYITTVPSGITGMEDYAARVKVDGSGSYDALFVSPAISLPQLGNTEDPISVSFKVAKSKYAYSYSSSASKVNDSKDDKFSLIVSTDDGKTWTRSNSTIWASDGSGDYDYNEFSLNAKRCRVDLSKYAGKSIRLGFFTESTVYDPDTYLYVDSVAINYYQPTCDGITNIYVLTDSITTQSVSLSIKSVNPSDTIEYVYGIDSVAFATAQPVHADSALVHLTGLQHSSAYAVYARTLCAGGDTSAWFGPVYFDTKCMASVPVLYNFDDADNRYLLTSYYKMENCWEVRYTDKYYMPYLFDNASYATYAYSGSSALRFYMTSSSYSGNNYSLAALPMIEGNPDTLQLSFMARAGYATSSGFSDASSTYLHSVMVGTMDNLNDTSTFRLIKEVVLEPIASGATVSDDPTAFWRQQIVSLEGAQGKYVVFFQKKGSKSNYIYIDDVRISKRLDCPMVDALSVDSITDTRARVHWTSQADNFVVTVVSETGKNVYNLTDTLLLLTDLKSDMKYDVSVASVCGKDTTFTVQRSFTTCISLPFSEDFSEGLPDTWLRLSGDILNGKKTSKSSSGSDWTFSSTDTYGISAPKMMWNLTKDYYEQNSVLATPEVLLNTPDATNPILLSFDMALTSSYSSSAPYASSTEDRKFAILVSEDDAATWTKIDSLVWGTDTTFVRRFDSIPNTSTRYTFDFSAYRNKSIRIAFYAYSPADAAYAYLHLSNVALKEQNLNCLMPTDLQAMDMTVDSATLCWNSDADMFQLQVAADAKFNKLIVDSVLSDTALSVGTLTASTAYYARVRVICGENSYSDWTQTRKFKTTYGVPFVEEFTTISTAFPADWGNYEDLTLDMVLGKVSPFDGASEGTAWNYNTTYNKKALEDGLHAAIELYSSYSDAWMVTPVIDMTKVSGNYVVFSFDAALTKYNSSDAPTSSDNQRFYLAVSEDGGATWSKEDLVTWSNAASDSAQYTLSSIPTGNGKNYKFDFSKYAGKTVQIAFGVYASYASSYYNRLHIDNVRLEERSSVCFGVEDVQTLAAMTTSAAMRIVPSQSDSVWQYVYGISGFAVADSLANCHNTDTVAFTLSNLAAGTSYDVYVRSVCAVGDTSQWLSAYTFRTPYALPLTEDFTTVDTSFPDAWTTYSSSSLTPSSLFEGGSFENATPSPDGWQYSATTNANAFSGDKHVSVELKYSYYSSSSYWLVSPVVDMTDVDDVSNAVLSFDVALTNPNTSAHPSSADDQEFYVAVSEDGGKTWTSGNATLWSEGSTADYSIEAIPNGAGQSYILNMNKYIGKVVQVAFGAYQKPSYSYYDDTDTVRIHLDNIRLYADSNLCFDLDTVQQTGATTSSVSLRIEDSNRAATAWQYVYGIKGFNRADSAIHNTDAIDFVLTGLNPSTSYDVYVRSACGSNDTTAWVGPFAFATAYLLPFNEDFAGISTTMKMPDNWLAYSDKSLTMSALCNGTKSFVTETPLASSGSTNKWGYHSSYTKYGFAADENHIGVELWYSCSGSWLLTPAINLSAVAEDELVVLSFDAALTKYNSSDAPSSSDNQRFYIMVSEDAGGTWSKENTILWSNAADDNPQYNLSDIADGNGQGTQYLLDFSKYKGKTIRIAFGIEASANDNYLHIDNVSLYAASSICIAPVKVTKVSATTQSLTLRIETQNTDAQWQYAYGLAGFALSDAIAKAVTDSQDFTLTGLKHTTDYDVYVRTVCGEADTSKWVGPFGFTTDYGIPFYEDFAGISTTMKMPDNWLAYSDKSLTMSALCNGTKSFVTETPLASSGSTNKWGYHSSYTKYGFAADENHIGVELWYSCSGSWLLTPAINLSAVAEDELVVLSFDAALTKYNSSDAPSSSDNQRFYIMVSEDAGGTWSKENTILWSNAADDNPQYNLSDIADGNGQGTQYLLDFSKYKGKTIRIAFGIEASANDNYLHIDNVSLYAASSICIAPVKVTKVSATTQSLTLRIETQNTDAQWQYAYGLAGFALSDAIAKAVTDSQDFTLTGLKHTTDYDVYVRTVCGEEDSSKWVGPFGFTTNYAIPFYEDFAGISTTMKMPDGWLTYAKIPDSLLFNGKKSFATETPLKVNGTTSKWGYNSSSTKYALSDENHLSVEISSYSNSGCWAVTPTIDLTMADDAGHILFAFDAALSSTYLTSAPSSSDGQRFYVAVSEDGGATWNKKNAILWSNTPADSADYMLSEISNGAGTSYQFDFSQYAGKVVQIAFGVMAEKNSSCLHIDNVHLYAASSVCFGVKKCTLKSATATSATLGFVPNDAAEQWQYAYGTAGFMLSGKTPVHPVDTTVFTVNGLAAQTQYDVYIRSICAVGDTSAWAGPYTVTTAYTVPFVETFDDMANVLFPADWTRYKLIKYADLIAGTKSFDTAEPYTSTSSSENVWGYNSYNKNALEDANHITIELYDDYSDSWMLSPVIDLSTVALNEALEFSFDAALTYWSDSVAPTSTSTQKFYIIVSEDGGSTWTAANTTTWGETGSNYLLSSIPEGAGTSYEFDFSKYAGKTIRIAFGIEVKEKDNRLHLDNIALKRIVTRDYTATACNSTDYMDEYFFIAQQDLVLGNTTYTTKVPGTENAPDTVVSLTLNVYPAVRVQLRDTICEGYHYNEYGFDFIAKNSTVVPQMLTSANGCDSLVELHIEVIPTRRIDTTIMACQSYTYQGETYYSDKVFVDTLASALGCDSIVRTFLRISTTGDTRTMWRTSVCQGDSYNDEVFSGLTTAGIYTQTVQNAYGCDSTVTLHLLVADAKGAVYDTIRQTDLPYLYEGEIFLGKNIKVGDYWHDVQSSCGQVTLFMHVYLETAIANTSVHTLHLTPNPAKVGEPVQIVSDIPCGKDYTVSVFSSIGQLVYHSRQPMTYLPGFHTAGIYTVRIVNAGVVYQTKLLVQ